MTTPDPNDDLVDRSTRKLGKVGIQVAGADVANANAVPITPTDGAGNTNSAAHPTFTDPIDRAARAAGKVGLQVAGADVTGANPVPTDVIDRAARAVGKVGIQVAGADVAAGNPVPTSANASKSNDTTSVPSQTQTATGNSADIDLSLIKLASLILNISAVSGTAPTLVVSIQAKDPISGNYVQISAFASQSATGTLRLANLSAVGSLVRIVWTIGGTTPSFTFSVSIQKET